MKRDLHTWLTTVVNLVQESKPNGKRPHCQVLLLPGMELMGEAWLKEGDEPWAWIPG